jgi:hypothetical protein
MSIQWYIVNFGYTDGGPGTFSGYFKVNTGANEVMGIYQTINNVTNFNNNVLGTTGSPGTADNVFDEQTSRYLTANGVKILISNGIIGSSYILSLGSRSYLLRYFPPQSASSGSPVGVNATFISTGDPTCFNEGTKILCLNKNLTEEYIKIENLRKGDLVKSFKHGYRKIDLIGKNFMVNNPSKFNECMYKMEKTDTNGLIEDLIVTGHHSILVDDLGEYKEQNDRLLGSRIIDGKHLLLASVSKDFTKLEDVKAYTYYHFILENNENNNEQFGIWANGVLTETPSKKIFLSKKFILLD